MIGFLRQIFVHDFWLKLFSLALAVLVWLTVSNVFLNKDVLPRNVVLFQNMARQEFYNIPLSVRLPAGQAREVTVNPTVVQVTVQGPPRLLNTLTSDAIRAEVNLTGIGSARELRKWIDVTVPSGIDLLRVVPSEAEVIIPPTK